MATFAAKTYSNKAYATFRPDYPASIYRTILNYHDKFGQRELVVDLGCGHGNVARSISQFFKKTIAVDPSEGMLASARDMTHPSSFPSLHFRQAKSENLDFIPDGSIDLVVSAQAAHWFEYPKTWQELARKVRPGGCLALWGYRHPVFVDKPKATEIMRNYISDDDTSKLGSFWPREGVPYISSLYRGIKPPENDWEDIQRLDYLAKPDDDTSASEEESLRLSMKVRVGDYKEMCRTWSAFHHWQENHPNDIKRSAGGQGDVIDKCFDEIAENEPPWQGDDFEIAVEFETFLLMARRKQE